MSLLKANRALEPRKSCKSNCMHRTTRLVIFTALAAPFVLSAPSLGIPEANADCQRDRHGLCKATGRPELEVVNRANKEVRCDLLDYDSDGFYDMETLEYCCWDCLGEEEQDEIEESEVSNEND